MKQIIVIYDDSIMPEHEVKSITGKKSFGDTIFKRVSLKRRMKEVIEKNPSVVTVLDYCKTEDYENIARPLAWGGSSTARVLLRLCPESACQPGPSLELSCRLEAGGCAVRLPLGLWAP